MDSANGRVLFRRHVAAQASAVAYDPNGHLLAVGTNRGIDLVDPTTGAVFGQLIGHGEPNALAFNHAGTLLGATTNLGHDRLGPVFTHAALLSVGSRQRSHPGLHTDRRTAHRRDRACLYRGHDGGYGPDRPVAATTGRSTGHRHAGPHRLGGPYPGRGGQRQRSRTSTASSTAGTPAIGTSLVTGPP